MVREIKLLQNLTKFSIFENKLPRKSTEFMIHEIPLKKKIAGEFADKQEKYFTLKTDVILFLICFGNNL